jgi:hypothetical protein
LEKYNRTTCALSLGPVVQFLRVSSGARTSAIRKIHIVLLIATLPEIAK